MSHIHTLTLAQCSRAEARSRTRRRPSRRLGVWSFIFAGATLILSATYLTTINAQSTDGYALRTLQSEKNALLLEVRDLDTNINQLSSIGIIEMAAQSMEFVAADDVRYFVQETGVAAAGGIQP